MAAYATHFESFKFGWLSGFLFWSGTLFWLTRVSVLGWMLLAAYCALYFGLFAMLVSWWWRRGDILKNINHPKWLLLTPAIWIGLEYLRAVVFTGFPWNAIGVTQYENLPLVQSASWGGVYAVSYLVALINTATALILLTVRDNGLKRTTLSYPFIWIALAILLLWVLSGLYILLKTTTENSSGKNSINIVAIQPNIPQREKWDADSIEIIYERLLNALNVAMAASNKPDLIIFPETVFPDFLLFSENSKRLIEQAKKHKIPIVVGSMDMQVEGDATNYYNSSFLFLPEHDLPQKYDKRHLVMFGEYVPFEKILFFVRSFAPIGESFSFGKDSTVFVLPEHKLKFSSLICFEDVMAYLSRDFVKKGARLLINQTNDGWFDPYWGAKQHLVNAVFRAVENKVPMVRVTNTGITSIIDETGKILLTLPPTDYTLPEKQLAATMLSYKLNFYVSDFKETFYTKKGDLFAKGMLAFATVLVIFFVIEELGYRKKSL